MSRTQANVPESENQGHTALMRAALEGRAGLVKSLLARGADVNAKDAEGRTALMFAVINLHRDVVHELLKHGADVNARAEDGATALLLATSCGDSPIVQALLNQGADLNGSFNTTGKNAVMLAEEKGYTAVVEILRKAKARTANGSTKVKGA